MIGIVILNYNTWKDTVSCIESMINSEIDVPYRIYVVDNASPISPSTEIMDFFSLKQVRYLQNNKNTGYAAGNNIGIKNALQDGCDTILVSNSDVRYKNGSISCLNEYLQKHPEAGIVGPKIILADGSVQKECMAVKTGMREKYCLRTRLKVLFSSWNRRYWAREHDYLHETFEVYAVLGCCFMMRRDCALEVTPLDEHTFLYEEELILGIHMEQKGWKTVYHPDAAIVHLHEQSTGGVRTSAFAYTCNVASEIYYCRRYLYMKNWQIWPLYVYRSALYLFRYMGKKDFKVKWTDFVRRTAKEFE